MWPWQQSVQLKYLIFWGQLLTLVAVLHLIVLYSFLFMQHGINLHDNLTITARFASGDLPVVFMPFYKHVPGAIQQINAQGANSSKKQSLSKTKNLKNKNNARPIIYKLVKPPVSKITKTKLSKNSAKVKLDKLKLAQKTAPKLVTKKLAPELKTVTKKLEPIESKKIAGIAPAVPETLQDKIKPVEQILPKSTEKISSEKVTPVETKNLDSKTVNSLENKKLESKVASTETSDINKSNLNNNLSATNLSASNNNSTSTTISSSNNSNQELAIGRKDLELLQLQDSLRGAVSQNWRPPLGFKRDLETVVEVFVDAAGVMERVDIKQSSGVLVFDASVELAINQVVWPSEAWGKSHTLTFKQ
jgi:outer membrane biosynthesis protein TonB